MAPTLRDFVAGPWKTACYDRCKPSTRRRIDGALRTQLLPAFGARPLDRIRPAAVHRWFDRYSRTAPGGANRTLDVLRQILNHAVACGHLARNPTRGVTRNRRPKPTRFLSRTEIGRLHAALDAHRGRGSALHLRDGKTGPRTVFLNAKARAILADQPRTGAPHVFPSPDDSSAARSAELSLWRKVRRQAGIEDARLHDLRHTFASHAVLGGVPLPVVARLLGHARERTTLRYAHVSDSETEAAVERIGAGLAAALAGAGAGPRPGSAA